MTRCQTTRRAALALAAGLALAGPALAQKGPKPQYGGELNVGNVYYTVSPLSFDAADWTWKFNQPPHSGHLILT